MTTQVQLMISKLQHLSTERLREVEDFIDFISERDQDQRLRNHYQQASAQAFDKVWDNEEDAIYDSL